MFSIEFHSVSDYLLVPISLNPMRTMEFNYLKSRLVVASESNSTLHTGYHSYYIVKHILYTDEKQQLIPVNEWSFTVDMPVTCVSQSRDGNLVSLLMEGCVLVYSIENDKITDRQVIIHLPIDE